MKKKAETNSEYSCEHCRRSFVRPGTLLKHLCEPKRRWDERDRPANRIAYASWLNFYQRLQPTSKKKEYRDFIASAYYGGFTRFGNYCVDSKVVNPLSYAEWLLRESVALDNWTSDSTYNKYLIEYARLENGMDAIQRSVEALLKIAEAENLQLGDVLRLYSANKLCHLIANGHISPWLLFNSESGVNFLGNLNQDQTNLIFEYINPDIWNIKFKRDSDTVNEVKSVLKQAGI